MSDPGQVSLRVMMAPALRHLRIRSGQSLEDLAKKTGIHRNVIWNIEHAKRSLDLDHYSRLCEAIGVNPVKLLKRIYLSPKPGKPEEKGMTTLQNNA